jgi:flagellar biosynthesis protein FliP
MAWTIEIIGIVILALLVVSIVMLPWPANMVLGGLALFSSIFAFIYSRGAKKERRDSDQTGKKNEFKDKDSFL